MSGGWSDIPEHPTLCIDYPWRERPMPYCMNCSQPVSNIHVRSHWGGCGIVYKYVTTRAADPDMQQRVRDWRSDLEWLPEHVKPSGPVEYLKDQPVQPMFAWERGEPRGEGAAGEYVRHLRSAHTKTGWALDFGGEPPKPGAMLNEATRRFLKSTGLSMLFYSTPNPIIPIPQEEPMHSITLKLSAATVEELVQVAFDLNDTEGLHVEIITSSPAEASPNVGSYIKGRYCVTDTPGIRRYLEKVCAKNNLTDVTVDYVTKSTGARSTRTIMPIRMVGNYLSLREGNDLKSFLVDRIQSVEGPAPEDL